jgi:hypothetical protein
MELREKQQGFLQESKRRKELMIEISGKFRGLC